MNTRAASDQPEGWRLPPAAGILLAAGTCGFPIWLLLHGAASKPMDAPLWIMLAIWAVIGFIMSAMLVIVGTVLFGIIPAQVERTEREPPPADSPPLRKRVPEIVVSVLLLAYSVHGLWVNDLFIPSRKGGMHMHGGWAALAVFGGLVSTVASLGSGFIQRKHALLAIYASVAIIMLAVFGEGHSSW
jgi:hypothetical protein